jgi:AraC-like DNA-binding protein
MIFTAWQRRLIPQWWQKRAQQIQIVLLNSRISDQAHALLISGIAPMEERLKPTTENRIAAFIFPLVIRHAVEGADRQEVARRLGFDLAAMEQGYQYVGAPNGPRTMWGELVRISGNSMIGWYAAGRIPLDGFGAFITLLRTARDLRAAFQMAIRFADTLDTSRTPTLRVNDDIAVFHWRTHVASHQQDTDFRSRVSYRILRELVPTFTLKEVSVPYHPLEQERARCEEEYQRLFQCPVHFGTDSLAFTFDAALLDTPLRGANDAKHHETQEAMEAIRPHRPSDDFRQQLETVYLEAIESGQCELTDMAERLGMTPSVYRKKLRELGTQHREQCQRARIALAESLLRDQRMSMTLISERLGYASATAFAKAFRQWTGTSPTAFRRSRQGVSVLSAARGSHAHPETLS